FTEGREVQASLGRCWRREKVDLCHPVIPGRCAASNPESQDSGSSLRAVRNDRVVGDGVLTLLFDIKIRCSRLHLALAGLSVLLILPLVLLLPCLLLGVMTAIEAAGGGAEHAVMAGIVAGNAADHG